MKTPLQYAIRLAILFTIIWFTDLLDAFALNVALPNIAQDFGITALAGEWVILGFLLTMTLAMPISGWIGERWGLRKAFTFTQVLYLLSSLGCGLAPELSYLIIFRLLQGLSAGLAIPLGLSSLMQEMPSHHWAKTTASMNMITLLAPALGPLMAGYVITILNWRWIFFLKLPLTLLSLILLFLWVKKGGEKKEHKLDTAGFFLGSIALLGLLYGISEFGKGQLSNKLSLGCILIGITFLGLFLRAEKKARNPLIPLRIFKIKLFSFGNIIQCSANIIFLGANFIIALYLQKGLGIDIKSVGWIMAAITPGMFVTMPIIGKFYNRIGPKPFMLTGLLLLSASMFTLAFLPKTSSYYLFALIIFLEGFASALTQTPNVMAIFCDIPKELKNTGSALYSLFKQISASLGVALTILILTITAILSRQNLHSETLETSLFIPCFIMLGTLPLASLICLRFINNKKVLTLISKKDHIETEAELGVE